MEPYAPHPDNWPGFVKLANEALKASQPKTYKRHIALMLEPSFDNHVLLQLQWAEEGIKWYRSVWFKHEDAPKFLNPIEQLKYIGKNISPTMLSESGMLNAEETESLQNQLRELRLNPYIDDDGGIVLDGCVHTLTFYTDYSTSCRYVWNYLPEEYNALQPLADSLKMLCRPH